MKYVYLSELAEDGPIVGVLLSSVRSSTLEKLKVKTQYLFLNQEFVFNLYPEDI